MRITLLFILLITHSLAQAGVLAGRVVRVTDGDTLVVPGAGNAQHKIRLQGIDAPVSYTHLTLPTTIGWCRWRWGRER